MKDKCNRGEISERSREMRNWTSREGCRIKLTTAEEPVNTTAKRAGERDGWRIREINSSVNLFYGNCFEES